MTRTVYCGVDFRARTQTVAFCDSNNGEVQIKLLDHRSDDLRQFYSQLPGKVIVGLESCGFSSWFEQLLELDDCLLHRRGVRPTVVGIRDFKTLTRGLNR